MHTNVYCTSVRDIRSFWWDLQGWYVWPVTIAVCYPYDLLQVPSAIYILPFIRCYSYPATHNMLLISDTVRCRVQTRCVEWTGLRRCCDGGHHVHSPWGLESTHCTMYSIQTAHCKLHSVHYVQCTQCTPQCTHCTQVRAHSSEHRTEHQYNILCTAQFGALSTRYRTAQQCTVLHFLYKPTLPTIFESIQVEWTAKTSYFKPHYSGLDKTQR